MTALTRTSGTQESSNSSPAIQQSSLNPPTHSLFSLMQVASLCSGNSAISFMAAGLYWGWGSPLLPCLSLAVFLCCLFTPCYTERVTLLFPQVSVFPEDDCSVCGYRSNVYMRGSILSLFLCTHLGLLYLFFKVCF